MKVANHEIVFREFPDEITLAINFSNCPNNCPGCHSTYLQQDIGEHLTKAMIGEWFDKDPYITCIGFMGGDSDPKFVNTMAAYIKQNYLKLKVGWYSGRMWGGIDDLPVDLKNFDYIKLGPYVEEKGPLDNPNTNQAMYMKDHKNVWKNITEKFWRNH